MIIGRGSIASMLKDREGFIFFAAGISTSTVVRDMEVIREAELLGRMLSKAVSTNSMFVYFSTIAQFYSDTDYTFHKKTNEDIIKKMADHYTIIRLGNVWGCTNKNTFINRIRARQEKGEEINIRDEYRYMISPEQIRFVTDNMPATGKHEISIFGEMLKVKECLKRQK